jgi:hypothetical protein
MNGRGISAIKISLSGLSGGFNCIAHGPSSPSTHKGKPASQPAESENVFMCTFRRLSSRGEETIRAARASDASGAESRPAQMLIRRGKKRKKRENLNLDFFTTASEEQFGEQEKPSPQKPRAHQGKLLVFHTERRQKAATSCLDRTLRG